MINTPLYYLLVVVQGMNVKIKHAYRKARRILVPYEGKKTVERGCAEDSV